MKVRLLNSRPYGYLPVMFALLALAMSVIAQDASDKSSDTFTVMVTAMPTSDRERNIVERLQPNDFAILENKKEQKIVFARKVSGTPVNLAILIQDDLVSRVNNEFPRIRKFITSLPHGSRVMTGYITGGNLKVREEFTSDLPKAAESLRILMSSTASSGISPYYGLRDTLKNFEAMGGERNIVLLVSDGLDVSGGSRFVSPYSSMSLDAAIERAQQNQVSVSTIYAPSVGLTGVSRLAVNFGQGCLLRLANETGGAAYFTGTDFVTFSPYFNELNEAMDHQWLITYQSSTQGRSFRKVEVVTDFDINLLHSRGYEPK